MHRGQVRGGQFPTLTDDAAQTSAARPRKTGPFLVAGGGDLYRVSVGLSPAASRLRLSGKGRDL
jgi:hypothetical protein